MNCWSTHDIGAVGYFAPRPILDIAGLVSPEVVPLMQHPDAMWALMQERGGKYLEALDNQVPGGDVHDPRLCAVFTTDGDGGDTGGRQQYDDLRAALGYEHPAVDTSSQCVHHCRCILNSYTVERA